MVAIPAKGALTEELTVEVVMGLVGDAVSRAEGAPVAAARKALNLFPGFRANTIPASQCDVAFVWAQKNHCESKVPTWYWTTYRPVSFFGLN